MLYTIPAPLLVIILFIGIILFYLLGLRTMQYRKKKDPSFTTDGVGPLEGAVLGLLSLHLINLHHITIHEEIYLFKKATISELRYSVQLYIRIL
jgi:hypothetical protein